MLKIAVALSGGIDSTTALIKLYEQGHNLIGLTMKTYSKEHAKCSLLKDGINDASSICEKLGIKHYIIDKEKEFNQKIISYFIDEYMNGRTPNACLFCNEEVKFKGLMNFANSLGYPYFATGHYAIVEKENNNAILKKAKDIYKDQSYFLSRLPADTLKNCIFPLGETTKKENIQFLRERGLIQISEKKESQEMCFVSEKNYSGFIKNNTTQNIPEGNIINQDKKIIAKHKGIPFYTIGQRRGLNVAIGKPAYVREINPLTNEITIGDKPMNKSFVISSINWLEEYNDNNTKVNVKVRYMHKGEEATIEKQENTKAIINFVKPVSSITKGQGAVGYIDDKVIFSGIIEEIID